VGNPRTRRAVHRPPACVRVGCPGPLAGGGGAPPPWAPQGACSLPVRRFKKGIFENPVFMRVPEGGIAQVWIIDCSGLAY